MNEAILRRDATHVRWGIVFAGAVFAVASTVVLGLFGWASVATTRTDLGLLVGALVVSFLAVLIGAAVAGELAGREGAYLNGLLVWCIWLLFDVPIFIAALYSEYSAFFAGLATLAGLGGALVGSAIGARLVFVTAPERRVMPGEGRSEMVEGEEEAEGRVYSRRPETHPEHPESRH